MAANYIGWLAAAGLLEHLHAAHLRMLELPSVLCQLLCLLNKPLLLSPTHSPYCGLDELSRTFGEG